MKESAELPWLTQQLQSVALMPAEPAADLWLRIAAARSQQMARRTRRRYLGAAGLTVGLFAVLLAGSRPPTHLQSDDGPIDWQARAQALELQLAALDSRKPAATVETDAVGAELARIDGLLQTAYARGEQDRDKYTNELVPLWKRRSELLNTLIIAQRQDLALTQI